MTSPARLARLAGVGLALTLTLAACGGGDDADGAPDDASTADFCDAIVNAPDALDSDDPDEVADAAHEYAEQLREVGTPDLDDDARAGFELYVDFLADIEPGDVDELSGSDFEDVFDGDDADRFEALSEVTADCGPGEVPSE